MSSRSTHILLLINFHFHQKNYIFWENEWYLLLFFIHLFILLPNNFKYVKKATTSYGSTVSSSLHIILFISPRVYSFLFLRCPFIFHAFTFISPPLIFLLSSLFLQLSIIFIKCLTLWGNNAIADIFVMWFRFNLQTGDIMRNLARINNYSNCYGNTEALTKK